MNTSVLELEDILKTHAARYPLMQPTDAVKLIYQNEFGGGHMIADEEACLNYLHREYEGIEKSTCAPIAESIGNNIARVHLYSVKPADLDALGKAFILSATEHKGRMDRFLQKLDVLRRITAQGLFSFSVEELEAYLRDYAQSGYPPVSHSENFRNAYHPAYRVILLQHLPDTLKNA